MADDTAQRLTGLHDSSERRPLFHRVYHLANGGFVPSHLDVHLLEEDGSSKPYSLEQLHRLILSPAVMTAMVGVISDERMEAALNKVTRAIGLESMRLAHGILHAIVFPGGAFFYAGGEMSFKVRQQLKQADPGDTSAMGFFILNAAQTSHDKIRRLRETQNHFDRCRLIAMEANPYLDQLLTYEPAIHMADDLENN
jgi:hypothetical protein